MGNIIATINDLIDRIDKRPLVALLALALSHSVWMTIVLLAEVKEHKQDLRSTFNASQTTIEAQRRALGLQDSLIAIYGRRNVILLRSAPTSP